MPETTNVISLNMTDGRREVWTFPDGTVVTMEVPADEPPITVKHAVYCLSSILHQTHAAVFS